MTGQMVISYSYEKRKLLKSLEEIGDKRDGSVIYYSRTKDGQGFELIIRIFGAGRKRQFAYARLSLPIQMQRLNTKLESGSALPKARYHHFGCRSCITQ